MGTISQKLTYLNGTKGLLKEAINDVGGELTDESTFRSYAEALNGVYENLPKITPPASNELYFQALKGRMDKTFRGDTEQGTSILPDGYTEVDYITGGNTQYIDTNFYGNQNTKIIVDMCMLGSVRIGNNTTISKAITIFYNGSSTSAYKQRWSSQSFDYIFDTPSNRHIYENSKNGYYIDNVSVNTWSSTEEFETTNNLMLGKIDASANIASNFKLYSCKIYDNNTLVRDFVPCFRDSDREVGLYDLVNGVFYTNQGTGVFTYGSTVTRPSPDYPMPIQVVKGKQKIKFNNRLPKEYTEVDYIESSGTQYIDTGFIPNSNTKYDVDIAFLNYNANQYVIGAYTSVRNNIYINANGYISAGYGSNYKVTGSKKTLNTKQNIKLDKNLLYINNELIWTFSEETFNNAVNSYLLARNYNETTDYFATMKLYSCKIYDNNTLVRDFIPCFRDSDEEVGLYDLVNNVFYTNQGTGVFTYGNIVTEIKELDLKSKNLWKDEYYTDTWKSSQSGTYSYDIETKILTFKGTGSSSSSGIYRNSDWMSGVLPNLFQNSSKATFSIEVKGTVAQKIRIANYNGSVIKDITTEWQRVSVSFDTYIGIALYDHSKTGQNIYARNFQIEEGEYETTSYEPYFDYELCKIDDYEDYFYKSANKWYLHNEIGYWHLKDYTFSYISVTQGSLFRKTSLSKAKKEALLVYSPIYKGITTSETRYNNTIAYNPSSTQSLDIIDNRYTTSNDFNAYIQTLDNINDKVYCVLRETTNTEITSPTLISQLESLQNQRSIDGTNTITSQCEEGLPVRIGVTALMKQVS